jgi:MoaF N-terminal domain
MTDEMAGKTLRWTFEDGPTAGKAYEHVFGADGKVHWSEAGGTPGKDSEADYRFAAVSDGVVAVSYLAPSGYTLTSILDLDSGAVVAFASNESELVVQRGTFEEIGASGARAGAGAGRAQRPAGTGKPRHHHPDQTVRARGG